MPPLGRRDSFLNNIIPLCVFLHIIIMSASNSKAITNVLLTGQTLSANDSLGYANSNVSLELLFDCNVILYDDKRDVQWTSKTCGVPRNCSLSLTDTGSLVLNFANGDPSSITANANTGVGKYVTILRRPEAELVIYAPAIWSTANDASIDVNNNEMVSSMTNLKNIPAAFQNAFFTGDKLLNNDYISENGYTFILIDCELILMDSNGEYHWQTKTHGKGKNCSSTLDNYGRLYIFDGNRNIMWNNTMKSTRYGNYALLMQSDGIANIYGPSVWSSSANPANGLIEMPTVEM